MARPSNRTAILAAALHVAGEQGMSGVTYDTVSIAADVSRGGLIYHFPSKEALIDAMVEHITKSADALTEQHLNGIPFEEATTEQRLIAFVDATISTDFDAEHLAIYVETMRDAGYRSLWQQYIDKWTAGPLSAAQQAARFAADGLWVAQVSQSSSLPPAERASLVARLHTLCRE